MKKTLLSLLAAALLLTTYSACTKDSGVTGTGHSIYNLCNYSPTYNADFAKIGPGTGYDSLFKIFLSAGNNYRTDINNIDTVEYYRWYPCNDTANYYIECQLEAGQMLTAYKTFSDTSCAGNVSSAGFDSLHLGMSVQQVQATLGGYGDNFRNDYNVPGNNLKSAWFRFTRCADTTAHIEVQFSPVTGLSQTSKSF